MSQTRKRKSPKKRGFNSFRSSQTKRSKSRKSRKNRTRFFRSAGSSDEWYYAPKMVEYREKLRKDQEEREKKKQEERENQEKEIINNFKILLNKKPDKNVWTEEDLTLAEKLHTMLKLKGDHSNFLLKEAGDALRIKYDEERKRRAIMMEEFRRRKEEEAKIERLKNNAKHEERLETYFPPPASRRL